MTTEHCPSSLALESHLLDPSRSAVAGHVAGCATCRERLEQMAAEGQEFARYVYPATIDAVEAAAARRPWWRLPSLLLPIPVAAALVAALFVWPHGPSEDYIGAKGSGGRLGLTVYTEGASGVAPVLDGGTIGASAALRFRVRAAEPCNLWILSIDDAGAVSRLFPAAGDLGAPIAAGEQTLPGGARLDGHAGLERLYALCYPRPVGLDAAERLVRKAAGERPERLRAPGPLRDLPRGAASSSVLLEKRP